MIRFILFIIAFALIGSALGKWIYLYWRKVKMKEEVAFTKATVKLSKDTTKSYKKIRGRK